MATQILMPALSPTMEEGKLAKWLVKEGDEVRSGDILAEIETDKATMEFEAVDEGKIGKILVPEGTEGVKVNQPIADAAGRRREAGRTARYSVRHGVDQRRDVGGNEARARKPKRPRSGCAEAAHPQRAQACEAKSAEAAEARAATTSVHGATRVCVAAGEAVGCAGGHRHCGAYRARSARTHRQSGRRSGARSRALRKRRPRSLQRKPSPAKRQTAQPASRRFPMRSCSTSRTITRKSRTTRCARRSRGG